MTVRRVVVDHVVLVVADLEASRTVSASCASNRRLSPIPAGPDVHGH